MDYKVVAINPGSTSTKIGCFRGREKLFSVTIYHDADVLATFETLGRQLAYRKETILKELEKSGIDVADADAFVGRGGGLLPLEAGIYKVNDILLEHARIGKNKVEHPARLGALIANELAVLYGKPSFVVNAPDVDELVPEARMTGVAGLYRRVHLHALNLKETAKRHCLSQKTSYEESRLIVCHLGGGISVSAHKNGRMTDGNDIVGGDGPMAPTRCGAVPVSELISYILDNDEKKDKKELLSLCTGSGGFVSLLGTSDAREVQKRADEGDAFAALVWDTMMYQIIKYIGAMAASLYGRVDAVLLTGGMANGARLVNSLKEAVSWIAPVFVYPGEFELEAMAEGACSVLGGEVQPKQYTGVPLWSEEEFEALKKKA